jgi:metal-responsive CopG/Arc/MetJ family transcriptional regulator
MMQQRSAAVTEVRTTLNLPSELARLVDDYWHAQRLRSRNDAIRDLLAYALDRKRGDKPTDKRR